MKAAIYLRIAPDKPSSSDLREPLHRLIQTNNWTLKGEYADSDDGDQENRWQALKELLEACRRGEVDIVVVAGIEQFALHTLQRVALFARFREFGVRFISLQDSHDFRCPEEGPMHMVKPLEQRERKHDGERIRAGLCQAEETGKRAGRPQAKVDEAQIVMLDKQGLSRRKIAKKLGIGKTTVCRILRRLRNTE